MRLRFIATALMALLCAGVWAQQQSSRPGMGQRNLLQQRQELRQQATPRAEEETVVISFDVKLWDERVPKSSLVVYTSDAVAYYDEASGLFTVECTFSASQSATIEVDMTDYRAVTFVSASPDAYSLGYIEVIDTKTHETVTNHALSAIYMPDGEYTVQATVNKTGDERNYGAYTVQPFTVAGDMEVPYIADLTVYHCLTMQVIEEGGKPVSGIHVEARQGYGVNSASGTTDESGKAAVMLMDGTYRCDASETDIYPQLVANVTMTGGDEEVTFTHAATHLLSVKVTGDLLPKFLQIHDTWTEGLPNIYLYDKKGERQMISLERMEGGYDCVSEEPLCLLEGEYQYEVHMGSRNHFIEGSVWVETDTLLLNKRMGTIDVTEDFELSIDLSEAGYSAISLQVVDGEGNKLESGDGTVVLERADMDNGLAYSIVGSIFEVKDATAVRYLPEGTYTARYMASSTNSHPGVTFTIAGKEDRLVQVPYVPYEEDDYATVNVRVRLPMEALELLDYYCAVYFHNQNGSVSYDENGYLEDAPRVDVEIDPKTGEGSASIRLPKGTYSYDMYPDGMCRQGTTQVEGDTELFLDFTDTPYLQVRVVDEEGVPLPFDDGYERLVFVYKPGQETMNDGYWGFFGFPDPGEYTVQVLGFNDWSEPTTLQTVTMGETSQTVDIPYPTSDPNNFTVEFELLEMFVGSRVGDFGTVAIDGLGETPLSDGLAVVSDLPAGTYSYTVQVAGYEMLVGTVEVNEYVCSNVEYDRTVYVDLYLKPVSTTTTNVDMLLATDGGMFRLFPTIATDVLHILPDTAADGEWTVRIISSQGMAMYAARHVLDAETVLPVDNLAPGLYLLTLDNGTETVTYKFVKR